MVGAYKQAFFPPIHHHLIQIHATQHTLLTFEFCLFLWSFSHLRQTAYAKAGLQRGFAVLCCSGHRLMAHHLISIIGQIAMMMKKCIIVHSMTHTANQPASLAAVCIQLRSEKRIRYSVIQEVLKDGLTFFHIVLISVLLHIQFSNYYKYCYWKVKLDKKSRLWSCPSIGIGSLFCKYRTKWILIMGKIDVNKVDRECT